MTRVGPPDRLSALDAAYLAAEQDGLPLHIGSLAYLDAAPLLDRRGRFRTRAVRAHVLERLALVPRLRRRLDPDPTGRSRPCWVDDDGFDIARHVRVLHLPPPGDEAQVLATCARLHEQLLDRAHPLWELWFLTGVVGGRVALVEKIHHALADGVTGVDVVSALFDGTGPAAPPHPAPGRSPERSLPRAVVDFTTGVGALVLHSPLAPPCSLNRTVSGRRRLEVVRRSLPGVRAVRAACGGTVNDVVLAALAGGLRALLQSRGEELPWALRALVPVSVRAPEQRLGPANRVAVLFVHLPVHLDDPAARLRAVRDEVAGLKRRHEADATLRVLELADHLPAPLLGPLSRLVVHHQPLVNLVVTNVPGSPVPLSILGARLIEAVPIVPLGRNLAVGVAALSYCDQLTIGIHVDPEAVPDATRLTEAVAASFDELEALAARVSASGSGGSSRSRQQTSAEPRGGGARRG